VAHAAKGNSSPGTLSPDARAGNAAFYGQHQAGVLTPQQASMMLVAFDVLASDKADLERLFRLLTQRIAFLTKGGPAPDTPNPRLPPMDSGILGPWISPDNLTITVSVGHSLFDERFGLADSAEKAAKDDPLPQRFAGCGAVPWRSAVANLRQYSGYGDPCPARCD
jgi:deferrochelatase/peroxidase EfeB